MEVTAINDIRTMPNYFFNRDTLVGKIPPFRLEEFGLPRATKVDSAFKASTSLTCKQDWKVLYAKELEEIRKEDEELEQLEALFSRRIPRGPLGSKYEGKSPFKCFACNKIGHFPSRCPKRNSKLEEREIRYFKPNLKYQIKHKYRKYKNKSCYYVEEEGVTDDSEEEPVGDSASGSGNGKDQVFYARKEDDLERVIKNEGKALAAKFEDMDEWVIDSGCYHHMIGDKENFLTLQ